MSNADFDSVDAMLDLTDPVMDMVDAEIDAIEDAEASLESCLEEADMALVDKMADSLAGTPGYILGKDIALDIEEEDPMAGINVY